MRFLGGIQKGLLSKMENAFLWAQIAGFLAMSCCVLSMQFKNSRHMILSGVFSGSLWATQYMLLNAPMGALMNAGGAIKSLFAANMPEKYLSYLLVSYLLIIWAVGLSKLDVWYGLFPLIGASCGSIAILINRDNRGLYARSVILCCSMWAVYNITVGAYMGLACDTMTVISALIGMYRHEKWSLGKCYKTFLPSIYRSIFPNFRTTP